jgi:hypothetical protein
MDRNHAFERQLASEIGYQVGPPRSVDALAVAREAQATTTKWRIRPMFSFTSISASTAVIVAAIAILLVGAPLGEERTEPVPAASQGIDVPVAFSGTLIFEDVIRPPEITNEGDGKRERGFAFAGSSELSDARLQGDFSMAINSDEYWKPGVVAGATTFRLRIENDDGAWEGTGVWADLPYETATKVSTTTDVLYGEGDYEGLIALMQSETDMFEWNIVVEGSILAADLPPTPERVE